MDLDDIVGNVETIERLKAHCARWQYASYNHISIQHVSFAYEKACLESERRRVLLLLPTRCSAMHSKVFSNSVLQSNIIIEAIQPLLDTQIFTVN